MRTFVLRARAAPTDSGVLLASVGKEAHPEILAHTLMNAIFVAQSHRADVIVYLVLESTRDYSRTSRFVSMPRSQLWYGRQDDQPATGRAIQQDRIDVERESAET